MKNRNTRRPIHHTSVAAAAGTRIAWLAALVLLLWATPAQAAAVKVTVLADTPHHTIIRYQLIHWHTVARDVDGHHHVALRLGKESRLTQKGAPALPTVNRSVLVGSHAKVQASVTASQHHDVHDIDVVPSKGILYRSLH